MCVEDDDVDNGDKNGYDHYDKDDDGHDFDHYYGDGDVVY